MYRRKLYVLSFAILLTILAICLLVGGGQTTQASPPISAPAAVPPQQANSNGNTGGKTSMDNSRVLHVEKVTTDYHHDISPPVRSLPIVKDGQYPDTQISVIPEGGPLGGITGKPNGFTGDPAAQTLLGPLVIPTPLITFDGLTVAQGCGACSPPDPDGDVGPNNYVHIVNSSFAVYDKSGTLIDGPHPTNSLWAGFGGPCQTQNSGDGIVLHDQLADRWLITQFTSSGPTYYQCAAVSQTSDPTGSYYRYGFNMGNQFGDYPKYAVWPTAYYLSERDFTNGATQNGQGVHALERAQMLVGGTAQDILIRVPFTTPYLPGDGLLVADIDGTTLPPGANPDAYVLGLQDNGGGYGAPSDAINMWKFHVDFAVPANSTLTGPTVIPVDPFNSIFDPCGGGRACIPQPGTANKIDILSYRQRLTQRLSYRNMGAYEMLLGGSSVEGAPNIAGMRWYEIRNLSSTPTIYQQGTYVPGTVDGIHRWMGSLAMDGSGNIALGYSVSDGSSTFPGSAYTGRLAGDPLGQMTQGEAYIKVGTGSQTGSQRWGDYTAMHIDPSDDCTFWYVNEYIPTTSSVGWRGTIGAFKFPGCGGTPTPTATGTPPTPTNTPIPTNTPTATNTVPPTNTPICSNNYTLSTSAGATIVPGTTMVSGSNCDDCVNPAAIPFPFSFYGNSYSSVNLDSNGTLQFVSSTSTFTNACEPYASHNYVIHAYWDDLLLTTAGDGIYTSVSGSAPNRIFNVEWRGCYYSGGVCGTRVSFEARLYEGTGQIDVIYATVGNGNSSATGGVQKDTGSLFLQAFCNGSGQPVSAGSMFTYTIPPCLTPTPAGASPTPTCIAGGAGWGPGATLPVLNVRAYGAYFPPNGKFYAMGGRSSDTAGFAQLNPLEYSPTTDTWITKTAVFSDQQTSNVQGGVVTMSGTPVILVVGGSAGGGSGATNETRVYDPAADTLTTLLTDPWPPGLTTVPGGAAVVSNKLYIFGGFVVGIGMSDEIWEFDPNASAGSRWTLKSTVLPQALGYIPTAAIGGMIYTAGGSGWDGTTIFDTDYSYKYDPTTDTITTITSIPRLTAETRAVNMGGEMWVLGGGRDAPNPSNEVDIYDPGTDSWSLGDPFVTARRNFAADADGAGHIYLVGGYAPSSPIDNMEIYTSGGGCVTPTETPTTAPPTNTPTDTPVAPTATDTPVVPPTDTATDTPVVPPTDTDTPVVPPTDTAVVPPTDTAVVPPTSTDTPGVPTATPTSCPMQFTDVLPDNTFYTYIRCLACRGIINGYSTGCETGNPCFRPGNLVTRGQLSKIVSNSAGFNDDPGLQMFQDVPAGSTFYAFINRLAIRNIVTGYPCGSPGEPCVGPDNLPYFRPNANITRGQLSKIVSEAAGYNTTPGAQQFEDVLPGSTFYDYIWRLTDLGIMNGYPCGSPGEPCVGPDNLPYFRPGSNATRGQASKIVANTFYPNCYTPSRPADE